MTDRITIRSLSSRDALREELAVDVRTGLLGTPKQLPPKYFYDARGSELFEEITRLPEYYLTRAETEILEEHAGDIVAGVEPEELFELGSGSSRKTRLILEAMRERGTGHRYVALDVSEDALRQAAGALTSDYPWLDVTGFVGDFHTDLASVPRGGRRMVTFLGSTIGNLEPHERAGFLAEVRAILDPDDAFLLGIDLLKDAGTLEAAYDDAAGVTAQFNLNVLRVVNLELGGDVPLGAFEHVAEFDKENGWVEMRLRAIRPVTARLGVLGAEVTFDEGEELRTEISAKFTRDGVARELRDAGMHLDEWYTDGDERFGLLVARVER